MNEKLTDVILADNVFHLETSFGSGHFVHRCCLTGRNRFAFHRLIFFLSFRHFSVTLTASSHYTVFVTGLIQLFLHRRMRSAAAMGSAENQLMHIEKYMKTGMFPLRVSPRRILDGCAETGRAVSSTSSLVLIQGFVSRRHFIGTFQLGRN